MSALSIQNISKKYKSSLFKKPENALTNLSLDIASGETFGFIGPNGAGKSTTIKIIMSLIQQDEGHVYINGIHNTKPTSRKGLAYVPENPLLYDYLTPLEILNAGCHLHHLKKPNIKQHCMHWLERFGLADVATKTLRTFSKGMTQRTALAHALCVEPSILILDEPLSGLDPTGRQLVIDILQEYKHGGGTTFFSSHVLYDVERLADRFGLVFKGELKRLQSPAEIALHSTKRTIRSSGSMPISEHQILKGNSIWELPSNSQTIWEDIEKLRQGNHNIIEIKPSDTLEQIFKDLTKSENHQQ